MKWTRRVAVGLTTACAVAAAIAYLAPGKPAVSEELPHLISATIEHTTGDGTLYRTITDVQGFDSLGRMVAAADLVVVGKVTGKAKDQINLARQLGDPSKEHSTQKALANLFTVQVEDYLKGDGPQQLEVLQLERFTMFEGSELMDDTTQEPYAEGERYAFFLKRNKLLGLMDQIGDPTAFLLKNGIAEVNSGFAEPKEWFKPRSEPELIAAIKKAVK